MDQTILEVLRVRSRVETSFTSLGSDCQWFVHEWCIDRTTPSYLILQSPSAQSILHKPKYKSYLNVRHMTRLTPFLFCEMVGIPWTGLLVKFIAGTKYQILLDLITITNIMYNVVMHLSTKTVLHQIQLSFLTVSFSVEQKKTELKIGWGKPAITENPIYNVDAIKLIITLKKLDWN